MIDKGAHHLDLRLPDDVNDPISVKQVREIHINTIHQWIYEYNQS